MSVNILDDVLGGARPKPATVEIGKIRTDGGTQMRAALDDPTVFEYTQAMIAANGWGPFPPVTVYHDGSDHWLGDGFHRVAAYREAFPASADRIPCEVRAGTRRDAILHAAGANANHGLRRTNADKQRAVETLLRDDEWAQWSDAEIARRCAVDPKTVGNLRRKLAATMEIPKSDARKGADGRTINTAGIGSKPKARPSVSPEQRQYTDAAQARTPLTVPESWQVQSLIERMCRDELYNLWPNDEGWLIDQIISKGLRYDWTISRQLAEVSLDEVRRQITEEAERERKLARARELAEQADNARQAPPAPKPGDLPADLQARGWELRQVPGSGRWYCNNPGGPRATGISDRPEDAIAEAYTMQRDLAWAAQGVTLEPVAVQQATAQPEADPRKADALRRANDHMLAAVEQLTRAHGCLNGYTELQAEIDLTISDLYRMVREFLP